MATGAWPDAVPVVQARRPPAMVRPPLQASAGSSSAPDGTLVRALVTGAGGMVGRAVVDALLRQRSEVVATARTRPDDLPEKVAFLAADLSDAQAAAALVGEVAPTHLVHAAWETRQPTYWDDPVNADWVASAAMMAKAFAHTGGRRFVQVGSCAEYNWSQGRCVEDVTPDRPATRYGKAKLAAYHAIAAAGHDRFTTVDARIFFVYGPRENPARVS